MDFLSGILDALGELGSEIIAAVVYLFQLMVAVFQFIWGVLQVIAGYILSVFKAIGGFFTHLWDAFFKGIFVKIWNGLSSFAGWLQRHLKPIVDFLKSAQKFIDRIYRTYIAPFIRIIQHVRQFLQILKLLHIKIAAQLDAILGTIQRDVQQTFFQIRGILNSAIDLLNIVADPTKLLRKPTLILSLRRSLNALIRQVSGFPPGYFFPSPSKSAFIGTGFVSGNFNPSNPLQNPPASFYLGDDAGVQDFSFLGDGEFPDNSTIDDVGAMGFFDSAQLPASDCVDEAACLLEAFNVAAELS